MTTTLSEISTHPHAAQGALDTSVLYTLRFAAVSGVIVVLLMGVFVVGYVAGYFQCRSDIIPTRQPFGWEQPPLLHAAIGDF